MAKKKLTPADEIEVRRLHANEGKTTRELGEIFGVAHTTIMRTLNKPGGHPGYLCQYCGRKLKRPINRERHEAACEKNPRKAQTAPRPSKRKRRHPKKPHRTNDSTTDRTNDKAIVPDVVYPEEFERITKGALNQSQYVLTELNRLLTDAKERLNEYLEAEDGLRMSLPEGADAEKRYKHVVALNNQYRNQAAGVLELLDRIGSLEKNMSVFFMNIQGRNVDEREVQRIREEITAQLRPEIEAEVGKAVWGHILSLDIPEEIKTKILEGQA